MGGRNPSQEYGKIEIIEKPRGNKYEKIVNFLDSTVCEYAKFNSEFYRTRKITDLAFGWGESQNRSIIWHSIRKSRYRALPFSERPYKLRGKNKRLDYWVLLNDIKMVLWVEYKHATAFISRRKRFDTYNVAINSLNGIATNWENDVKRLRAMKREGCKDLCFGAPQEGWKVVRMNLLVLPICRRIKKSKREKPGKAEKVTLGHEVFYGWSEPILKEWHEYTEPNFVAAWSLHEDFQQPAPWHDPKDKNTVWWDTYYGVYFFAWLDFVTE